MENKLDWIERHKTKSLIVAAFIIWGSLLVFFWMKAEAITTDPCTICSQQHGEKVVCTIGGTYPVNRIYYVNKSIEDIIPKIQFSGGLPPINASILNVTN